MFLVPKSIAYDSIEKHNIGGLTIPAMEKMFRIPRLKSLRNLYLVVTRIRNWPTFLASELGLARQALVVLQLRNESRLAIRQGTEDGEILFDVMIQEAYNREGFGVKEDDIVVDIGANIGAFTVMSARIASHGHVYAFEPEAENFRMLAQNVELNRLSNVSLVNKAVAKDTDQREMYVRHSLTGGHSLFYREGSEREIVSAISFAEFVKEKNIKRIDLMKIDCEGAEYEILMNCPDRIMEMIRRISMEYHLGDMYSNPSVLKILLESKGFMVDMQPDSNIVGTIFASRGS